MLARPIVLLSSALLSACLGTTQPPGTTFSIPTGPGKRVLFIGNSLTYANDLPSMLRAVSIAAGDTPYEARMVAFPDYSLEDHWLGGAALTAIRATNWDVVVMQQGPSSLPENQIYLRDWAVKFNPEIRTAGAVPALYMVWPSRARSSDFPGVHNAYLNAAAAVNGVFVPVGDAWLKTWESDQDFPLYGPDAFHPSLYGTYLAALVLYETLSGKSVVGLPAPQNFGISAQALATLQRAAHESVLASQQ